MARTIATKVGNGMYTEWIYNSTGLPREGQQIEFLLDYRNVAMAGSYTHQTFRSNWTEYSVDQVLSWRNLRLCDPANPTWNQAERVLTSATCPDTSHFPLLAGGLAHAA